MPQKVLPQNLSLLGQALPPIHACHDRFQVRHFHVWIAVAHQNGVRSGSVHQRGSVTQNSFTVSGHVSPEEAVYGIAGLATR